MGPTQQQEPNNTTFQVFFSQSCRQGYSVESSPKWLSSKRRRHSR